MALGNSLTGERNPLRNQLWQFELLKELKEPVMGWIKHLPPCQTPESAHAEKGPSAELLQSHSQAKR